MWWRVLIIAIAYLLIGAHFLRFNQIELAIFAAILPSLMLIKHVVATRLLQLGLVLGCIFVWGISTVDFVQMRMAMDAPWLRLACIMSGVMAFTLFAAYCCNGLTTRDKGLHLYY
ncbi:hypothetical protein [Shewanella subflava]|uniref:Uncharacterized protein n=1 Tax=Shewanella subflava TaxID=2986476 RepID=A0ABT3I6P3_9GAMM|nr:hypothetical protein [Shewanella subflava]MCW3171672.1 hypothetical protein [Shewanella subflava]